MTHNPYLFWAFLTASSCLAGNPSLAPAQSASGEKIPLTITLLPTAAVDDTTVFIDQIAKITGGSGQMRMRSGRLDVSEFAVFDDEIVITAEQVRFRMMLAGISPRDFRIEGESRVIVTEKADAISARRILAHAYSGLLQKLGAEASAVSIRINHEIFVPKLKLRATDRVVYQSIIATQPKREGKTRVDVAIAVNGSVREVIPLLLETVVVGTLPIDDRRPDTPIRLPSLPNMPEPRDRNPEVAVRNRDKVRLVVQIANTKIETRAEALEDGRLGEIIRVRNLTTGETRSVRIEGAGVVVMRLD